MTFDHPPRDSLAPYVALAELVGEGVLELDGQARILSCNSVVLKLLGRSAHDLVGSSLFALTADASERQMLKDRFAALGDGLQDPFHCRLRFGEGANRELRLRWMGLGRERGAVVVIEDGERLRTLERQRLEAMETTETARRIKGEFLANMSHELRTPISGILGILEMLLGSRLDAEQRANLLMVRSAARSLLRLMDSILDYSRLEAGALALRRERFDLQALVDKALAGFAQQADAKGLRLSGRVAENAPKLIWGDPARLGQLLVCLIGNAVKFTERGSVSLDVGQLESDEKPCLGEAPGRARFLFTVRDTGPGVPESMQEMIFQIFNQVDGSLARRHDGAGLGLAVASQLAKRMGGKLWLESEPGQGSAFFFCLPAAFEDAEQGEARIGEDSPAAARPAVDPKPRVLVAEDNPLIQKYLRHFLGKHGYQAELTINGEQALRALCERPFDVALMDVQMPGMDGLEVTRRVREFPDGGLNKDIPIIALTAHALRGDRERFIAAGMDDYVAKPINFQELMAVIERLTLARGKAAPPAAPEARPAEPRSEGLDRKAMLEGVEGDTALVERLLDLFRAEAPVKLERLRDACRSRNVDELREVCHYFVNVLSALRADEAGRLARQAENRARQGRVEEAVRDGTRLVEKLDRLLRSI